MSVALAFTFFLAAVGLAVAYGMTNREHPTPLYDWQAAGDFPEYLAADHNPTFSLMWSTDGTHVYVVGECSCGYYTHIQPVTRSIASARAAAEDEFWTTHTYELGRAS